MRKMKQNVPRVDDIIACMGLKPKCTNTKQLSTKNGSSALHYMQKHLITCKFDTTPELACRVETKAVSSQM